MTLFSDILAAGLPYDSHETDLLLPDTPEVRAILARHPLNERNAERFLCEVHGRPWLDVPFAFPRGEAPVMSHPRDRATPHPQDVQRARDAAQAHAVLDSIVRTFALMDEAEACAEADEDLPGGMVPAMPINGCHVPASQVGPYNGGRSLEGCDIVRVPRSLCETASLRPINVRDVRDYAGTALWAMVDVPFETRGGWTSEGEKAKAESFRQCLQLAGPVIYACGDYGRGMAMENLRVTYAGSYGTRHLEVSEAERVALERFLSLHGVDAF